MTNPTFSDDETREIFRRAAEREEDAERAQLPPGAGTSVERLREIAGEVGMSPDQVEAAARAVARERAVGLGGGLIQARREVAGAVTDDAWRRVVDALRGSFQTRGATSQYGAVREWSSTRGGGDVAVTIRVEPGGGGAVLTAEQPTGHLEKLPKVAAGASLTIAVLSGLIVLLADSGLAFVLMMIFLVAAAGSWLLGPAAARTIARRDRATLERALDRAAKLLEAAD